jgi:hypothetical protein
VISLTFRTGFCLLIKILAVIKLGTLGKDSLPERRRVILKQKEIIEQHIQEYKGY